MRIRELESSKDVGQPEDREMVFEKPVFVSPLTGQQELVEGQHAHFQARVVPVGDPNLRILWFVNGVQLPSGWKLECLLSFSSTVIELCSCGSFPFGRP